MYTKADLEREFGLSKNTVRDTLKCCGLNTGRREYTQDEYLKFVSARQMLEQGKTYQEVADHFRVGARQVEDEAPSAQGTADNAGQETVGDVKLAAFQIVNKMAEAAMKEAVEKAMLPLMKYHLGQSIQTGDFFSQVNTFCEEIEAGQVGNSQDLLQVGMEVLGFLPESLVPALPASID
jgi:glutamyl/glutaminyl-tRNA synthetase